MHIYIYVYMYVYIPMRSRDVEAAPSRTFELLLGPGGDFAEAGLFLCSGGWSGRRCG